MPFECVCVCVCVCVRMLFVLCSLMLGICGGGAARGSEIVAARYRGDAHLGRFASPTLQVTSDGALVYRLATNKSAAVEARGGVLRVLPEQCQELIVQCSLPIPDLSIPDSLYTGQILDFTLHF
jgi:hypothetical protein